MAKIDIEEVGVVLQREDLPQEKRAAIMAGLEQILRDIEEEKAGRPPAPKKQLVMLVSDPEGKIESGSLVGWIVAIPEDESPVMAPELILRAANDFNTTPKGRRLPVETYGEACESVSAKFFKEHGVAIRTKTPVYVITTVNKLPRETLSE
jgi:hypothetical protein